MRLYFLLVIFAVSFLSAQKLQYDEINNDKNLPLVAFVTTGGTIAEKYDPEKGGLVPFLSGKELIASIPDLKKYANYRVYNFSSIDSSQMTPEIWLRLSKTVDSILDDPKVRGVVVIHGTDTMAEGSFFLDLTLSSNKPVVFTGAMKAASDPYSDGPSNLIDSIVQICSDMSKDWGVTITMNSYINSSRSAMKTQTTNPQTFESKEKGYLGYIHNKRVYRFNDRLYRVHLPRPKKLPRIEIIFDYAGADGESLRYAVDNGAEGIIVEGMGSGNVNKPMYEAIKYAIDKGIPVVITTNVFYGAIYADYSDFGGGASLKKLGVILSGDLRASKSRILLMLSLPEVGKNWQKMEKYFNLP